MSLNTAHANNGVLIHAGEYILLFSENVNMEFSGQDNQLFRGSKNGRIYLTTHRMIFNNKNQSDPLQSFSFPFISLTDVDVEQPTFGSNFIKGKVRAQPNGNWIGEAKFKLYFKSGGAIDFGQAMLRAARMAQRNAHNSAPPPYTPPTGGWYEAPLPAYQANPQGYYGWVPPTQAFPNSPPPNSVFMTDNPPPYPGIIPPQQGQDANGYSAMGNFTGYPGNPAMGSPPANYTNDATGAYPPQTGYQPPGYSPQQPGFNQPPGFQAQGGVYLPQQPGYAPHQQPGYPPHQQPGYPPHQQPGYPPQQQPGYSPLQPGYPPQGYPQSPQSGAMGERRPPNSKEAEAAQSAYYDPNQPQTAYVPPPSYYEPPPSYNSLGNKKDQ